MGKIVLASTILMALMLLVGVVSLSGTREEIKGVGTIVVDGKIKPEVPLESSPSYYLGIFKQIPLSDNKNIALINHAVYSGLGIALTDKNNSFVEWLPEAELKYFGEGDSKYAGETLDWWVFKDLDNDDRKELAIRFGDTGTAMIHPFYLYSFNGNKFDLLLKLVNSASETEIKDLDNDGEQEIIYEFSLSGGGKLERDLLRWKDIWRLEDGKPVKVNDQFPHEYQDLVELYQLTLTKEEWEPYAKSYHPTLRCLREKVELTIQGELVEIEGCRELLRKRYK